jgi:hypothetical protein
VFDFIGRLVRLVSDAAGLRGGQLGVDPLHRAGADTFDRCPANALSAPRQRRADSGFPGGVGFGTAERVAGLGTVCFCPPNAGANALSDQAGSTCARVRAEVLSLVQA